MKAKKFLTLLAVVPVLAVFAFSQPMEITVCSISHTEKNADEKLELLRQMGVTSVQTYIYWNKVEKEPGVMDWSEYDADVALFKKHGLKWVPFVIAGPWYVTPEFVRRDPQVVMLRCLEHGRESAIPSLWGPRLREYVREYLRKFAAHYGPQNVLESVNLGITGDYGEAIYSVIGNWPGEYHSHGGFWCGDSLAVADFQRAMKDLYAGDIARLNAAWRTQHASFEDLRPFLPDQAPSPRARLEFLRWYRDSMTAYARFWLAAAREFFPQTEIYLCTGGDMAPEHGSDFSAQAKAAAQYQAGIRITNEASSFTQNVALTRLVASACRHYGAYFGHEPAAAVTPEECSAGCSTPRPRARASFSYQMPELIPVRDGNPVIGKAAATTSNTKTGRRWSVRQSTPPSSTRRPRIPMPIRITGRSGTWRRNFAGSWITTSSMSGWHRRALKTKSILILAGRRFLNGRRSKLSLSGSALGASFSSSTAGRLTGMAREKLLTDLSASRRMRMRFGASRNSSWTSPTGGRPSLRFLRPLSPGPSRAWLRTQSRF
jgi:hypothetical protein